MEPFICNFDAETTGRLGNPCLNVASALNLTCMFPFFRRMLTAMPVKTDPKVEEAARADFSQN